MNWDRLTRQLVSLALQSPLKHKIGALCLDHRGRIVGRGYNQYKTHPVQAREAAKVGQESKVYLHAEIRALLSSRQRVNHVLTLRLGNKGDFKLSKPCPICEGYMKDAGVSWITYTDENVFKTIRLN